ncbi:MAG: phosphodiesterase [Planctomycetaceae bacterium]
MTHTLIQISDLHLFDDPDAVLKNVRTWGTFERVLNRLEASYAHADAIIITGDLAHDERFETYEMLQHRLGTLFSRVWVVPGNHDHRLSMAAIFSQKGLPGGKTIGFQHTVGGWQLLGLDSQLTGETAGELDADQLAWLTATLKRSTATPTLVFLHHPPVSVGSPWLDAIGLKNAETLGEILRGAPHVRGVFFGHIHQEFEASIGTIECYATPSTGVQFTPETETLQVDTRPPGFRVITLGGETFETHVVRVLGD